MDAENLGRSQKRAATIWAFWDRVTVHLQARWQEQRERVVRVCEEFPLKGERGTSAQCCWPPSCPLCMYPSYKGCNTQVGLYNSTWTHTHKRQADANTYKRLPAWTSTWMHTVHTETDSVKHTHTHTHSAVSSLSLSVTPGEGVEELLAVPHWHSGLCVWVSVKPSNYRQPLHIHRWPDWLGIPRGISPKPLTHISNANTGRCRKMDASYFWKLR